MSEDQTNMNRRNFLTTAVTAAGAGLAGCSGDENGETGNQTTPEQNTTPENNTETPEETEAPDEEETTPEEDYTAFEELYAEAERKRPSGSNAPPIDFDEIDSMLSSNNTEAENVAIAATQASLHEAGASPDTEDMNPEAIRYALDELGLNAYADNRTAFSGGEVTITEIYAENDDGTVQKVMVTNVPDNTDEPLGYSLIAGEEPEDEGPVADNNLKAMWNEEDIVNFVSIDYEALKNSAEEHGGQDEIPEDQWEEAWNKYWEGFNSYLLDNSENLLGPSADAWKYLGDQEKISSPDHSEAYENWREINTEVEERSIGSNELLRIDYEDEELNFEVIPQEEYDPAEIHSF